MIGDRTVVDLQIRVAYAASDITLIETLRRSNA